MIFFALSLLLPAPDFVLGMGHGAFAVWVARLIWVIGLPLIFCLVLIVAAWIRK